MRPLEEYLVAFAKGCLAPPPKETVSEWCERTRQGDASQAQAFAQIWPSLKPEMLKLSSAIEAWLSSYHSL